MIVVTAIMKAKDGEGDNLEKVIKKFAAKFLTDPGTLAYRVHRRADNPNIFFFYENYENNEALTFHSSAPHFKEIYYSVSSILS